MLALCVAVVGSIVIVGGFRIVKLAFRMLNHFFNMLESKF